MDCNACGGSLKTINTRKANTSGAKISLIPASLTEKAKNWTYRRKSCSECGERLSTFEMSHDDVVRLVQSGVDMAINNIKDIKL